MWEPIAELCVLVQQCQACLVHHTWMVYEMGRKWLYSCLFFFSVLLQDFFKTACNIVAWFSSSFFFKCFSYIIIMTQLHIIFYMDSYLLIAIHAFLMWMLISLSVDEILLPRYVKWCTNFRIDEAILLFADFS